MSNQLVFQVWSWYHRNWGSYEILFSRSNSHTWRYCWCVLLSQMKTFLSQYHSGQNETVSLRPFQWFCQVKKRLCSEFCNVKHDSAHYGEEPAKRFKCTQCAILKWLSQDDKKPKVLYITFFLFWSTICCVFPAEADPLGMNGKVCVQSVSCFTTITQ